MINILGMAMFGLITVQAWPNCIPSLVFTPIIMKRLNSNRKFHDISLCKFYMYSIICGVLAGVFILLPCVLLAATESADITLNWLWAGMVAGVITFPVIASIYRFIGKKNLYKIKDKGSPSNGVNLTA